MKTSEVFEKVCAIEEAARSAKLAHEAKVASGTAMNAARVRLLVAVLAAALPGLDALAAALRLFDLEVQAVLLASRERTVRLRERLFALAPISAGGGEAPGLLLVTLEITGEGERLRKWRKCTAVEALDIFSAGDARWVERVASELLRNLKRAAEGNNNRRAKEWGDKALRLEALALLLEHESRSAK